MDIKYSDIKFERTSSGFKHNLATDFACFALWKPARPFREKIRKLLSSRFEIILETEIEWSKLHFHDNAARLYEVPVNKNMRKENWQSGHARKIGDPRFIFFVIKDSQPLYTFAMSVSKRIELSNLNVVKAKYEARNWILKETGVKFGVHSTNNLYEFFFQATLILGPERVKNILERKILHEEIISKDLEGAGGWNNYHEAFKVLKLTSNYLILRGFENLPEKNEEKDIDLLTDDYQRLASVLGAYQLAKKPYKGFIKVGEERISLDMRFVGDKYYTASWEKDMLKHKVLKNGIFIPRADDYFFSLLFHCKVQKEEVKEKYYSILEKISKKLKFEWFNLEQLSNNEVIGNILNGFFQSQGYYYEEPIDEGVFKNQKVIKFLPTEKPFTNNIPFRLKIRKRVVNFLPKGAVKYIKKTIRK